MEKRQHRNCQVGVEVKGVQRMPEGCSKGQVPVGHPPEQEAGYVDLELRRGLGLGEGLRIHSIQTAGVPDL